MDIERAFTHVENISESSMENICKVERSFVDTAETICSFLPDSREKSLFITKFQEAKFWAVECIAKNCG